MSFGCSNGNCKLIQDFEKKFLCSLDLKYLNWEALLSHLCLLGPEDCENHINLFLASSVEHPLVIKLPNKISYQRAFIKHFITKLESANITHDKTYEKLVELLSEEGKDKNYHFKHFSLNDKYVTVKETQSFVTEGTTGLYTWQAGITLVNWGLRRKEIFDNKKVLELGSGVGLTGIALITFGAKPISYTFSDYHPAVLENLALNIQLNANENQLIPTRINETIVDIANINWETIEDDYKIEKPDIVLAADVVYDSRVLPSFCAALKFLLASPSTFGIVACTKRNPETIKEFKLLAIEAGLKICKEKSDSEQGRTLLYYPTDTPVKIFTVYNTDL